MKKLLIYLLLIFLNPLTIMAQQNDYYPEQRDGVSDADYKYGINILKQSFRNGAVDEKGYNCADYWNFGIAYIILKEDISSIKEMLHKSKKENEITFSKVFLYSDQLTEPNKWKSCLSEKEYQEILEDAEILIPEGDRIQPNPERDIHFSPKSGKISESVFDKLFQDNLKKKKKTKTDWMDIVKPE